MKKVKSLLSILLVLVFSIALFSGCGTSGNQSNTSSSVSASAASAAPVTVTMYMLSFNRIPDDYSKINDAVNQYIAKTYPDANVKLDLKLFGPADYANKIQLAQQSGTDMDIFVPLGLQSAIAQNQCADIKDYIEKDGKEMTAILKKDFGDDAFKIVTQNGHVWAVPINKAVVITPTFIYDKDMFAKTGYSIDDIKTLWDLDKVFAKIKELYPDVYPYSAINAGDTALAFLLCGNEKIDLLGGSSFGGLFTGSVIGNDGKVINLYESDIFRKYVDLMHDWYLKGYMPQDMATSGSTAAEIATSGRLFSTFGSYAGSDGGAGVGKLWTTLTGKNFEGKWIGSFYMDTSATSLAMAVSSASKNPEAAVKFLNILYTDAFVTNTILYGIEGEDYVKVSDHVVNFPKGLDSNTVPYTAYLTSGVMGSNSLMWNMTSEDDFAGNLEAVAMNKTADRSPYYGFNFDQSSVLNELTAIQNVVTQYYPGLTCGSLDPAETLPVFNQALKDAGLEKVMAEKQKQLDAWLAQQK
jgi:putative aldouronate transport system substrate-binding protein